MDGRVALMGGVLGLALAVGACDRNAPTEAGKATGGAQSSSSVSVAADPFPTLARAVYATRAEQAVDVRFELPQVPVPGKRFELNLTLLARMDATALKMTVTSPGALTIIDGASASWESLKTGESQTVAVHLAGAAAGLYVLDLVLTATTDGGSLDYKYSIPVAITTAESSVASSAAASASSPASP